MNLWVYVHMDFWVLIVKKKKNERKEERDIKYNEKDTFTHIFNGEKGEVGNGDLMEVTSGGLSDNFQTTGMYC